jgi:hypothetical protein
VARLQQAKTADTPQPAFLATNSSTLCDGLTPGKQPCPAKPPAPRPSNTPQNPTRLEATAAAGGGGPYGKATEVAAAGDCSRLLSPVAGRKGAEEGLHPSCLTRIYCSAMPWVECTGLRYHCTKFPDVNLCPEVWRDFEGF